MTEDMDYRDITEPPDIEMALKAAWMYGQDDGDHHRLWVIDQMVRALTGHRYLEWVADYEKSGDMWDTGISP